MSGQIALEDVIAEALERAFGGVVPETIGVAVSGGGDSMALLDLLRLSGVAEICIASVNHGLREEAADELTLVAAYAAQYGLSHDILKWHWDGTGNLQAAARDGRRAALRGWAVDRGIAYVAMGHTADDQAETFLMRLARGSGVDGLAGMAEARLDGAVTWLRPALGARREALRVHLRAAGIVWADDPSNEDTRFDRVKARQMMQTLAPLGLTVERLVQTSQHMARESDTLRWAAGQAKARAAQVVGGDVVLDVDALEAMPESMALRVVADALCFVSGETYRPRFKALKAALESRKSVTLHGCLILSGRERVIITRELKAVQEKRVPVGTVWDGRWRVFGPEAAGLEVGVFGEGGFAQCPDWRAAGVSRQTLLASPAVWRDEELIAAPLAEFGDGWYAELVDGRAVFG
ncbi:tRNA(Ile)-lysidine synthase [Shimia sp. SK013]|uniref:tRNA lysidine(34) synthetase TilS n=1 Tax=Shimia sp. SK013 TaxID=1389006 RepID=UPI0006CDF8DE|nr:tRNA lysidine(34) synthetase TilS [Shimia sp. SK013]KPA20137.1 tRNA(Ile)-lysidine synthase [Shimia sp. SK013]